MPLNSEYADARRGRIACFPLRLGDLLFGMFGQHEIENTHERARTSIGHGNVAGDVPVSESRENGRAEIRRA